MLKPEGPIMETVAKGRAVTVVVVPFPAQGHLNQLLHFSILLSSHGLPVHFAGSATHSRQARHRLHGRHPDAISKISFHDLPLPPISTPPPEPGPNFPIHLDTLFQSLSHLQPLVASLLRSISTSSKRLVLVHDPLMSFAAKEAALLPNAEVYKYRCAPIFYHLSFPWAREGREILPGSKEHELILTPFEDTFSPWFLEFRNSRHFDDAAVEDGFIYNTCRPVEGEFIDLLAKEPSYVGKGVFAVGPINPVVIERSRDAPRNECLKWLEEQPPASVVYVAFGSTTTMSDDQITQLAVGLERSRQRFIWVLRDADGSDVFAEKGKRRSLPDDYEQRVAGFGMVLREWAPQLEVLAHKATGGFMSHCGWNSCMEGMSMGVPILAWPVHSDQPRNAMAVTEYLNVGVMMREWARRKEVVPAEAIEEAIKRVMVDEEGKEIRKRAKALGQAIRAAVSKGGSSSEALESFVDHITR